MNDMKRNNPFLVEGYAGDEYFCDRRKETETMLQALRSRRNITLISLRRMGKSGLIHHVFSKVKRGGEHVTCFYVDIFHTRCLRDFINVFASEVFGQLDTPIEKLFRTLSGIFKKSRPVISSDPISGMPTVTLDFDKGDENHTLKEVFDYLSTCGRPVYIAFDEFQQINEYPETGVEALLRSLVQLSTNVSFVFAGSKKHLMQEMFTFPGRPFYQSTQTVLLGPIDSDSYYEFAEAKFRSAGMGITREAFEYIYNEVFGHTWYVQYWLSRLFDAGLAHVGKEQAIMMLERILLEEDDNFYMYTRLLTSQQLRAIRGIALARKLEEPYAASNIKKYDLPVMSTMKSCITRLLDKEMIVEERGVYSVYNRFFMLWLVKNSR